MVCPQTTHFYMGRMKESARARESCLGEEDSGSVEIER